MNGWIVLILAIFLWAVIDRLCECLENIKSKKDKKESKED